jgi:hypothetical protein
LRPSPKEHRAYEKENWDNCCDEGDDLENHCPLFLGPLQAGGLAFLRSEQHSQATIFRVCRLFLEARTFGDDRPWHDPRETEGLSSQAAASQSMMQDRERAMLSTMGGKRRVRSLPGWLYSLMPKFVLGSAKNERTQPHPQRPIDRNLYAGLRRPRYRPSTRWCLANYSDPLAGGSRRHKMTREHK